MGAVFGDSYKGDILTPILGELLMLQLTRNSPQEAAQTLLFVQGSLYEFHGQTL